MKAARVAAVLRAVVEKDLTPGDVHVPSAGGDAVPKWPKGKRRRVARILSKLAGDPGLYVGRRLTPESDAQLRAWWATHSDLPLDDNLHVTVVHSRVRIPWEPAKDTVRVARSQFLGVSTLGKDRAQVLRFRAPPLQMRWSAARREGATWDHPAYTPHLTLFYDGPEHAPLPPFDLTFGPEVAGPLTEDVFKWGSVEGFLSGQDCEESLAEAVHNSWMEHCENPTDPHNVPYPALTERSKQVDRDAVRAVLRAIFALGYDISPMG